MTETQQRCLLLLLNLLLLVHSSSSLDLAKPRGHLFSSSKLQSTTPRSFTGHLSRVTTPVSNTSLAANLARQVENSRQRLQFLSGAYMIADNRSPVSAVPGEYAMSIQVGTPAQTFTAIADTGSDLVWFQCEPCTQCFTQPDQPFSPSKSSTYNVLSCSNKFCEDLPQPGCSSNACTYEYSYGDKSTTSGDLSSDTITLSGDAIPAFTFGCGTQNQGTFNDVDGLVGLGRGPLSLPSQLGSQVGHKFAYCLVDDSSKTSPIIFGDSAVPSDAGLVYTPLVSNTQDPTYYYVTLLDINVDGKQLNLPSSTFAIDPSNGSGGIIFDSGTTITQLAQEGYDALTESLKAAIEYPTADGSQAGLDTCFDVSAVENPTFPSVTFNFAGADFVLPTKNTFVFVDTESGIVCLAMAGGDLGLSIFGNIQQATFKVVYDLDNSRLGWVSAQC